MVSRKKKLKEHFDNLFWLNAEGRAAALEEVMLGNQVYIQIGEVHFSAGLCILQCSNTLGVISGVRPGTRDSPFYFGYHSAVSIVDFYPVAQCTFGLVGYLLHPLSYLLRRVT